MKRIIVIALLFCTAAWAFANGQEDKGKSDFATVRMYLMGNAPPAMDQVLAEINDKLKNDLNAELEVDFSTWSNWKQKYNILLSAGEEYDLIYSAIWTEYPVLAKKGAFMDVKELVPEYAPNIWKNLPREQWKQTEVGDGAYYGIPNAATQYQGQTILYREDLRKKYGLAPIDSLESMENYLTAISENEDQILPMANPGGNDTVSRLSFFYLDHFAVLDRIGLLDGHVVAPIDDFENLQLYWNTKEFEDLAKRIRKWAEAGYWSPDAISLNGSVQDLVANGRSALTINANLGKARAVIEGKNSDSPMEFEVAMISDIAGYTFADPENQDMMSIPRSSKHPEKALQVLDKLTWDREYFDLSQYGIKGIHYNLKGEDIDLTGFGLEKTGYGPEAMNSWCWRNDKLKRKTIGGWEEYYDLEEKNAAHGIPNPYSGINLDFTNLSTEQAAINNVMNQYGLPLFLGVYDDVDEAIAEFREKLKEAGIDKYFEEIRQQALAYKNS